MNRINIWNENQPIITEEENFTPFMTFHKAAKSINKTILILPGGGYVNCCDTYEGEEIAEFFNSFGVDAFVLRYRTKKENLYPMPFLDATRAMRYIRANANKYGINPNCLGIMGFSAGGHLAAWVSTKWDDKLGEDDLFGKYSARPDFSVLCYPVIDLFELTQYAVTGQNLLGNKATDEVKKSLCMEYNVTENTPPTFLYHTQADQVVPVVNSIKYYEAMVKNGVKGELHIYEPGPHGSGLGARLEHVSENCSDYLSKWPELLRNWVLKMIN